MPFATDEIIADFTANVISIGFDVQNEMVAVEDNSSKQQAIQDKTDNSVAEEDRPDGSTQKILYDKEGVICEEYVSENDMISVLVYDKGIILEVHASDNGRSSVHILTFNSRRVHDVYNADGSGVFTVHNEDGSITTYCIDSNGNCTKAE